jgi:glucose-6-phosphate isomerase
MAQTENRFLKDLRNVLYDELWAKTALNFRVYSVKRGVKFKDGLRYDQTLIYPRMLGQEFPKTKGHEHPPECAEAMKVLKGKAIFLLQRDEGPVVKDAYFIKAKSGQCVFSPSGYSHVTINPTDRELKIGTWVADLCPSSYQTIEKLRGACYY